MKTQPILIIQTKTPPYNGTKGVRYEKVTFDSRNYDVFVISGDGGGKTNAKGGRC